MILINLVRAMFTNPDAAEKAKIAAENGKPAADAENVNLAVADDAKTGESSPLTSLQNSILDSLFSDGKSYLF